MKRKSKKTPEALVETLAAVHGKRRPPAKVDPNPAKRTPRAAKKEPPFIQAWLRGGCMVCGKPEREGLSFSHQYCLQVAEVPFTAWAAQCLDARESVEMVTLIPAEDWKTIARAEGWLAPGEVKAIRAAYKLLKARK
jgi:hypothetical protein